MQKNATQVDHGSLPGCGIDSVQLTSGHVDHNESTVLSNLGKSKIRNVALVE